MMARQSHSDQFLSAVVLAMWTLAFIEGEPLALSLQSILKSILIL